MQGIRLSGSTTLPRRIMYCNSWTDFSNVPDPYSIVGCYLVSNLGLNLDLNAINFDVINIYGLSLHHAQQATLRARASQSISHTLLDVHQGLHNKFRYIASSFLFHEVLKSEDRVGATDGSAFIYLSNRQSLNLSLYG